MSKIIQKREHYEETFHALDFFKNSPDGEIGFSFPCDKHGMVDLDELSDVALDNLNRCLHDKSLGFTKRIKTWTKRWVESAILRCDCGVKVYLHGFTNTCPKCGADYNSAGQRLACRSQWGEETGENLADIMRIA